MPKVERVAPTRLPRPVERDLQSEVERVAPNALFATNSGFEVERLDLKPLGWASAAHEAAWVKPLHLGKAR